MTVIRQTPSTYFGATDPSRKDPSPKTAATETPGPVTADQVNIPKAKRSKFFQGGLGAGLGRAFKMAILRPRGWLETAIDITVMMFSGFLVPPPFITKHFIEGLVGANTFFKTGKRSTLTNLSGAHNKKFYVGSKELGIDQNRTVWGALKSLVTRKPDAFDRAKFEVEQAAAKAAK
jgi:hypothetical protein